MKKQLLFSISIIILAFIFISWGGTGHYKINYAASLSFNQEMSQFNTWINTLANHASDADYRKDDDPNEAPKHYIDIDNYSEFNSNGTIPQTLSGAIAAHSSYFVYDNGILPWATITAFDSLKNCFQRKDWSKAVLFASDLGHYVADGHMPLHITRNYNGYDTDNDGIHSRYESTMINSYISQINYSGENIAFVEDVNQYVFNYIYSNYIYVDSVIAADDYAKSISSDYYSDQYKTALWNYSKHFTIKLFKDASHALAELIYTAWVTAGSPSMTATGIETPIAESALILEQNYPNPFSESTTIQFTLKESSLVILQIKDLQGQTISTLVNENNASGTYKFDITSENLSNGIYYITIDTDKEHQVKTMMVVK
ncbi:MAG: T9SS type A sorting domain-containing protein [Bacteroidales bacterium]